jgi:hypothetical protein
MRADDGECYATKLQNNPQSTRVLANEFLACRIAQLIGLRVPQVAILQVDEAIIREQQIAFTIGGGSVAPKPGPQFGSRWIAEEQSFDFLPRTLLNRVQNIKEFAAALAFDKWTGNADGRQAVFHRSRPQRKYTATFIDFGYAFNAAEWSFPDSPLRGTYAVNEVYAHVRTMDDFSPWLERIENVRADQLRSIAEDVPVEWNGAWSELQELLARLMDRRRIVRQLIDDFRTSSRNPFPNWQCAVAGDGAAANLSKANCRSSIVDRALVSQVVLGDYSPMEKCATWEELSTKDQIATRRYRQFMGSLVGALRTAREDEEARQLEEEMNIAGRDLRRHADDHGCRE